MPAAKTAPARKRLARRVPVYVRPYLTLAEVSALIGYFDPYLAENVLSPEVMSALAELRRAAQ